MTKVSESSRSAMKHKTQSDIPVCDQLDTELQAMQRIVTAMRPLDDMARQRIAAWACAYFLDDPVRMAVSIAQGMRALR